MRRRTTTAADTRTAHLEDIFGSTRELAADILAILEADPDRRWEPDEIIDATSADVVNVMMVLARLTVADLIDHDGIGAGYQAKKA